jgi:hypothetical protein
MIKLSYMATREFITHEKDFDGSDNVDAWVCICENTPTDDGFYPCDEHGNEMSPVIGSGWKDLYVCARCGRIIDQNTLEVVGRNPQPKMLD